MAMAQNPVPPVNTPIPTKIGSKMDGEFTYPKMEITIGFEAWPNVSPAFFFSRWEVRNKKQFYPLGRVSSHLHGGRFSLKTQVPPRGLIFGELGFFPVGGGVGPGGALCGAGLGAARALGGAALRAAGAALGAAHAAGEDDGPTAFQRCVFWGKRRGKTTPRGRGPGIYKYVFGVVCSFWWKHAGKDRVLGKHAKEDRKTRGVGGGENGPGNMYACVFCGWFLFAGTRGRRSADEPVFWGCFPFTLYRNWGFKPKTPSDQSN